MVPECELVTNCNQLKLQNEDGKMRLTDTVAMILDSWQA